MKNLIIFVFFCIFSVFVASIITLSDYTRLDIHNIDGKENNIEILNRVEKSKEENDSHVISEFRNYWFWSKKKLLLKVTDGKLAIHFMGKIHYHYGKKDKLTPQYVDFKSLTVNKKQVTDDASLRKLWYEKNSNGKIIQIKIPF